MLQNIPAKYRTILYVVLSLLGLAIGATQVGYLAAAVAQPTWLTVVWSVYGFVAAGLGFPTAKANVPTERP